MTSTDDEKEKSCVVLGGLDGHTFVETLTALQADLGKLKGFVVELSDAVDVGPAPMASIGYEVDRDALVIDHLDTSLGDAISRLINLKVMTRTAQAALARPGLIRS